jgi:hypothetical protein
MKNIAIVAKIKTNGFNKNLNGIRGVVSALIRLKKTMNECSGGECGEWI